MSEISKLTEDILTTVKDKAREVIARAEAENEAALEEAKLHASREAEEILRNARAEAEGVRRRQSSEVRRRLNLREQQEKAKIIADVLEDTRRRVVEFARDENRYVPLLVGLIVEAIRELELDSVVLHLNAQDLKRLDRSKLESEVIRTLGRQVKIRWSGEPIEALGGVIVTNADGKIRILNTLDQRFNALESKLLIEAGKLLFQS